MHSTECLDLTRCATPHWGGGCQCSCHPFGRKPHKEEGRMPLAPLSDPITRFRQQQDMIRTARRQRNRMLVCIFPTADGPCMITEEELQQTSYSNGLEGLQDHLRDEHLGDAFIGDENYDAFKKMLDGYSMHMGADDDEHRHLSGAYIYSLRNDQVWLFAGTSDQFDEWIREHQSDLVGLGNQIKCKLCDGDHYSTDHGRKASAAEASRARRLAAI